MSQGPHATDARAPPYRRTPARAHLGLSRRAPGGHRGQPPAPLGLGVAGRAPGRGRRTRRRTRAHARTHGGPHADGPAAPAPGRGAESRAGEGSRRADGKQPEATDRKRKWRRAPPSAPHLAPATRSAGSLRSRRFRGPARPSTSLPARERRGQTRLRGLGDALERVEASERPGQQTRPREVGEARKGPRRAGPARPHPRHPAVL